MTVTELQSTNLFKKPFTPAQLHSIEVLDLCWAQNGSTDKRQQAYLYATTFHETGATMLPIKEWGSQKYLTAKPYYPYIGYGYCMLTWKDNYERVGKLIGEDLVSHPEKALEPAIAAKIIVGGMINGWFTGKKLHDYINETECNYFSARKIINALDKAMMIERYAIKFEKSLN